MVKKERNSWKHRVLVSALFTGTMLLIGLWVQREAFVERILTWQLQEQGLEEVALRVRSVHFNYLEVESLSFKHGEQKVSAGHLTFTYGVIDLFVKRRLREIFSESLHIAVAYPLSPEETEGNMFESEAFSFPSRLPFDALHLVNSRLSLLVGEQSLDLLFSGKIEGGWSEVGRGVVAGEGSIPTLGAFFSFRQEVTWTDQELRSVSGKFEIPRFFLDSGVLLGVGEVFPLDYHFEGWVAMHGQSFWHGDDWDVAGVVAIEDFLLTGGEGGGEVSGLFGVVEFASLKRLHTLPEQEIQFSALREGALLLENGHVVFEMEGLDWLSVQSVDFEWGEGNVSVAPFSLRRSAPDFTLTIEAKNIELARILDFVPDFPAKGEAKLEGRLTLRVQPDGFDLQPGNLKLMEGSRGYLRIESPGLLTEGMSPNHPDYERRRMTEAALRNVEFSRFSIELFPEGEPGTALIMEFLAEPVEERRIREVPVSLYLHADLQQLLRLGMRAGFRAN